MTRRPLSDRSGVALVLTILVVALLVISVFDFFYESWIESSLAASYRDDTRALFAARSGQEAAKLMLMEDARDASARDTLGEGWAQATIPLPIDDEFSFIAIRDESGKIDLNQLTTGRGYPNERWIAIFQRLLDRLELDPDLAGALVDWIDEDSEVTRGGAESGFYLSLPKPYRAKNAKLDSPDELTLVRGFTPKVMRKLRNLVTLWGPGKININTADPMVLWALHDEMTIQMVEDVVRARARRPFDRREDIRQVPGLDTVYPDIALVIDVKSDTYSVESTATFEENTKTIRAVYKRSAVRAQTLYYKLL